MDSTRRGSDGTAHVAADEGSEEGTAKMITQELESAIDLLAAEDPGEVPMPVLAEQVIELHRQMARLQAQIARRSAVRWKPRP
ncbi:hypothetical protein [Bailinhaonella thermotolerans]|uniref:Uncharacterized protein n=1 Tax=Bailinhaonella thermotolerans TaxID=1070861 RepID=A0A3A4ASU7_9ACTN|nr:hypothetical protein [Bailinhaonella thermotolerans]RJL33110.1 hypothetical protein D5H75_09645 [Bailinhaonella thermotolerans]